MSNSFDRGWDKNSTLGSLAQSARSKQLRSARIILFVIAGWLFLNFVVGLLNIDKVIEKAGPFPDLDHLSKAYNILYVIIGGLGFLALLYTLFGIFIRSYPVPITITALVLYIGLILTLLALEPRLNEIEIGLKILVIIGLSKAIQAAIAYKREEQLELEEAGQFDDPRQRHYEDDRLDSGEADDRRGRRDSGEADDRRRDRRSSQDDW